MEPITLLDIGPFAGDYFPSAYLGNWGWIKWLRDTVFVIKLIEGLFRFWRFLYLDNEIVIVHANLTVIDINQLLIILQQHRYLTVNRREPQKAIKTCLTISKSHFISHSKTAQWCQTVTSKRLLCWRLGSLGNNYFSPWGFHQITHEEE